jgi:hypothetical protein
MEIPFSHFSNHAILKFGNRLGSRATAAFDADQVLQGLVQVLQGLVKAFEGAWKAVRGNGVAFPSEAHAKATRELLALRIIEIAQLITALPPFAA